MRSGVARAFAFALGVGALASCSLLAPSDDEAMAGLAPNTNGSDGSSDVASEGGADAKAETGSRVCPGCQAACNKGQCSACYLNGAACATDAECCGGACNANGTCGASAGSCGARDEACSFTPDSCCSGLTCSAERGARCDACRTDGDNCKADTDCCSLNCDGNCAACMITGNTGCKRARQCCSGICNAGTCG